MAEDDINENQLGNRDLEKSDSDSPGMAGAEDCARPDAARTVAPSAAPLDQLSRLHELLEAEIERLRLNLDNLRLVQGPEQRELIKRHVAALDERQDALADLRRLVKQAEADAQSGPAATDTDSLH